MKKLKQHLIGACFLLLALGHSSTPSAQTMSAQAPDTGNPIFPGWFADPTIKKFGDIYYVYATTDNEMLASGAPTVWYSKDFEHWYNYTMEIPSLESVNLRNFWAPDIIKGDDGKYYLFFGNCQAGCNIYGYVSDSPVGPWTKLSEEDIPVIPHNYPRKGFPSLDAQFFRDTDGKIYAYWGTWVHYNGGYAVGELDQETMSSIKNPANIPLEQTPGPFEAPYMMKKGSKYILMYSGASCHDETYNVRYSYADTPYGPFTAGENSPILSTTEDGSVHGPGHHSVLKEGTDYYIAYHRHDYPMTRGGLARQVSIDKMIFENDSTIRHVLPTHRGVKELIKSEPFPDELAFMAPVEASSSYHLETPEYDFRYKPEYAVDRNNATMWKAADNSLPQHLTIDLGKVQEIARVMTHFEFASYYYQYILEHSKDGENWEVYADRSDNRTSGSPMVDDQNVEARYLRLRVLDTEMTGLFAAVWEIEVYDSLFEIPLNHLTNKASAKDPAPRSKGNMIVKVDFEKVSEEDLDEGIANEGTLGGTFSSKGQVQIEETEGQNLMQFIDGALVLADREVPETLAWNGSYTVATWVRNPEIDNEGEVLASWCDRHEFSLANSYNAMTYNSGPYGAAAHLDGHFDMRYNNVPEANQWHHLVLTFDGVVEKIYVDGKLDNSQVMTLASAIDDARIIIGASDVGENYSGYMASFRMYDYALDQKEVLELKEETTPDLE